MFRRGGTDTISRHRSLDETHGCRGYNISDPVALSGRERLTMRTTALIVVMLMLAVSPIMGAASGSADTPDRSKGFTVDDLWRGLKSAEANIEREIPKIGPAIADTWKKITRKAPKKQSSQNSENQKK
jgi:hypothetical protein